MDKGHDLLLLLPTQEPLSTQWPRGCFGNVDYIYISLLLKLVNNFPLHAIKIQISHQDLTTNIVDKDLWTEFDTQAYFIWHKEVFQKIFKSLLMFEKEDTAH